MNNATNSIKSLMDTTLDTIKGVIDANTIVGDPIRNNNTVVVPISKITIGFGIGGGEYSKGYDKKDPNASSNQEPGFAGGSGAAISVQPVAFVVVENEETRLMSLDHNINMIDTVLNITPKVIEKLQNMKKGKQSEENMTNAEQTIEAKNVTHDILDRDINGMQ